MKILYDAHLKNKAIAKGAHFHYLKRLRYYLDFCEKYRLDQLEKENVVHLIRKLKAKKQTDQQQKQAYHAVSPCYELAGPISFEKQKSLENRNEKLARKKDGLKPMNADWVPVYDGLVSEIKFTQYSPKTLKSNRSWIRQ